jgi:hypothetical protein
VRPDPDSGAEVCGWSGTADGLVVEFKAWLDEKPPALGTTACLDIRKFHEQMRAIPQWVRFR